MFIMSARPVFGKSWVHFPSRTLFFSLALVIMPYTLMITYLAAALLDECSSITCTAFQTNVMFSEKNIFVVFFFFRDSFHAVQNYSKQ